VELLLYNFIYRLWLKKLAYQLYLASCCIGFYFTLIVVIILVEIIVNALAGEIKRRIITMNIPDLVIMIKEPTLIP
jgi:hypothetical protein